MNSSTNDMHFKRRLGGTENELFMFITIMVATRYTESFIQWQYTYTPTLLRQRNDFSLSLLLFFFCLRLLGLHFSPFSLVGAGISDGRSGHLLGQGVVRKACGPFWRRIRTTAADMARGIAEYPIRRAAARLVPLLSHSCTWPPSTQVADARADAVCIRMPQGRVVKDPCMMELG